MKGSRAWLERVDLLSEVYWSSCYNANLWKIRHILQIGAMRNKLPILLALILMVVAAMPWLRSLESQRWSMSGSTTTVPPPEQCRYPVNISGRHARCWQSRRCGRSPQPSGSQSGRLLAIRPTVPGLPHPSQTALPKPQVLLDRAVRAVETPRNISARIKQQGELFGHPITGNGRYYELRQGPIPQIHLELTVEVGSVSTSLMQVCNGTTFWTYTKLPRRGIVVQARRGAGDRRIGAGCRQAAARGHGLIAGTGRPGTLDARPERPVRVHVGRRRSTGRLSGLEAQRRMEAGATGQTPAEPEGGDGKGPEAGFDPPAGPIARQRDAVPGPGRLLSFPHRLPPQRAEVVAAVLDAPGILRAEFQRADRLRPIPLHAAATWRSSTAPRSLSARSARGSDVHVDTFAAQTLPGLPCSE